MKQSFLQQYALRNARKAGFTLVETLIAILILSMTIGALMTLAAGGYFSVRYARNDILATNLLQESLEYIRNNRDSTMQQAIATQQVNGWEIWKQTLVDRGCFKTTGCLVDPYARDQINGSISDACSSRGGCPPMLYFPDNGLYGYEQSYMDDGTGTQYPTTFKRTIRMETFNTEAPDDQIVVTATMEWKNGTLTKTTKQSIILTKWVDQ